MSHLKRLHCISIPHTITNTDFNACAYTMKVYKFCKMMNALGHHVFHYGNEGADVPCEEKIDLVSKKELCDFYNYYGDWKQRIFSFDNDDIMKKFNALCIQEMKKRVRDGDMVLTFFGNAARVAMDSLPPNVIKIEPGIGYDSAFCPYRVYESHSIFSYTQGRTRNQHPNPTHAVIPNYFDEDDFNVGECGVERKYWLVLGRVIHCKGGDLAFKGAMALNEPIKFAGQGDLSWLDIPSEHKLVDFEGYIDIEKRRGLLSNAKGLIILSRYLEPFGGVAMEAMMSGTPVIASNRGAFPEIINNGVSGFVVENNTQMVSAMKHIHLLDRTRVREHAIRSYSLPVVGKRYEEFFTNVFYYHFYGSNVIRSTPCGLRHHYDEVYVGQRPFVLDDRSRSTFIMSEHLFHMSEEAHVKENERGIFERMCEFTEVDFVGDYHDESDVRKMLASIGERRIVYSSSLLRTDVKDEQLLLDIVKMFNPKEFVHDTVEVLSIEGYTSSIDETQNIVKYASINSGVIEAITNKMSSNLMEQQMKEIKDLEDRHKVELSSRDLQSSMRDLRVKQHVELMALMDKHAREDHCEVPDNRDAQSFTSFDDTASTMSISVAQYTEMEDRLNKMEALVKELSTKRVSFVDREDDSSDDEEEEEDDDDEDRVPLNVAVWSDGNILKEEYISALHKYSKHNITHVNGSVESNNKVFWTEEGWKAFDVILASPIATALPWEDGSWLSGQLPSKELSGKLRIVFTTVDMADPLYEKSRFVPYNLGVTNEQSFDVIREQLKNSQPRVLSRVSVGLDMEKRLIKYEPPTKVKTLGFIGTKATVPKILKRVSKTGKYTVKLLPDADTLDDVDCVVFTTSFDKNSVDFLKVVASGKLAVTTNDGVAYNMKMLQTFSSKTELIGILDKFNTDHDTLCAYRLNVMQWVRNVYDWKKVAHKWDMFFERENVDMDFSPPAAVEEKKVEEEKVEEEKVEVNIPDSACIQYAHLSKVAVRLQDGSMYDPKDHPEYVSEPIKSINPRT